MLQKPLIRLRNLKELQSSQKLKAENENDFATPIKVKKPNKRVATTAKKKPPTDAPDIVPAPTPTPSVSTAKRVSKSSLKEPPPSQLRIDTFFKSCQKTYKIAIEEEPTPIIRKAATEIKGRGKTSNLRKKSPRKMGRKRLFLDETSTTTTEESIKTKYKLRHKENKPVLKINNNNVVNECISLISDTDEESEGRGKKVSSKECKEEILSHPIALEQREEKPNNIKLRSSSRKCLSKLPTSGHVNSPLLSSSKENTFTRVSSNSIPMDSGTSKHVASSSLPPPDSCLKKRKTKVCPPYKIIEGTTFAVDAFQYGYVTCVTHYFLTHFHMDHYIGLTKKFAMPLYMSPITARLVRACIPLEEQYIHEIDLNAPIVVNNIEITALDANHCPGSIMLLFKFPDCGKCILHTGDFRAWHGMESEPVFWNNDVNTIYLDTTYVSQKYAFCTQSDSIERAKDLVQKFREKHADKRILYICGSYVIGKEKFWSSLAEEFKLKVWTEQHRGKALKAIDDAELNKLLIDDPLMADMHVITLGKVSYLALVEYFATYEHHYDILLALRPSGWEKDSRPQYRGKINIIGIEYSEHSSYEEMQRFVKFLKPQNVISTVPTGRDLLKTAKVPEKWYKYETLHSSSNYQPCIEQFLGKTPQKKSSIRLPNANKGGVDTFVSPLSKKHMTSHKEINNNQPESIVSIVSSDTDFEKPHTSKRKIVKIPTKKEKKSDSQAKVKEEQFQSSQKKTLSQNLKNSKQTQLNGKTNTKLRQTKEISHSQIKEEKITSSQNLKDSSNFVQSSQISTKKMEAQTESKTANNQAFDLVLSQNLKDGESCSIFIPNSPLSSVHKALSIPSSDYFEMPLLKDLNRRRKKSFSSAEEFLPISQKNNTRTGTRKINLPPPMPCTLEEDEPEFECDTGYSNIHNNPSGETPTTSKMGERRAYQNNPLLRSTTPSCASSLNEEVAASQTSQELENTPRPIRNKGRHLNDLENDIIPASQTTQDLENTPRPIRNKVKESQHAQQTKIISRILGNTPRPSSKKCDPFLDLFSQNEIIPASQTSKDLENTPRPIRNKRNKTMPLSLSASTPKKTKENHITSQSTCVTPPSQLLSQILNGTKMLDVYNASALAGIVAYTLADQPADKSLDHIPQELLSDPDADDDWLD